jgi:hypothetical protein
VDFVWPSVFEIEFAGERFMMQRKACSAAGSIRMPAILTIAGLAVLPVGPSGCKISVGGGRPRIVTVRPRQKEVVDNATIAEIEAVQPQAEAFHAAPPVQAHFPLMPWARCPSSGSAGPMVARGGSAAVK